MEKFIYISIILIPLCLVRFSVFNIPTSAFEILTVILGIVFFLKNKSSKIDLGDYKYYALPIVMILVGLVLSSAVNGAYRSGLGVIKGWFLIPMAFAFIASKEIDYKNIFKAIYTSAFIVSAIALGYFLLGKLTFDGRLQAFYSSPNYLAMYLAPAILIGAVLFRENKKWYANSLVIMLFSLYLTFSYAAWLAVLITGVVVFVIFEKKHKQSNGLLWVLLSSMLFFLVFQIQTPKMQGLLHLQERSSASSRIMIWTSASKIIQDNWVFGIGPNQFQNKYLEYQKYFPPYLEWAVPEPHNLLLAFWLQAGLLGLIGFVLLIWRWLRQILKVEDDTLAKLSLVVIMTALVHGIFDTTYFKQDLAFIFWLGLMIITKKRS